MNGSLRLQLYFSESIFNQMMRLASSKKESMASLVENFLIKQSLKESCLELKDWPFLKMAGCFSGPPDLSGNLDNYLYGI